MHKAHIFMLRGKVYKQKNTYFIIPCTVLLLTLNPFR